MFLADKAAKSPLVWIVVALLLGLRFYSVYQSAKRTPKRSPRVQRIEKIVAISLWTVIALGVIAVLLTRH